MEYKVFLVDDERWSLKDVRYTCPFEELGFDVIRRKYQCRQGTGGNPLGTARRCFCGYSYACHDGAGFDSSH